LIGINKLLIKIAKIRYIFIKEKNDEEIFIFNGLCKFFIWK
jgi:hypothetical protein